jgi:glutathione S-transferase
LQIFSSLFGILNGQIEEAKADAKEQAAAGLQLLEDAFGKISKGKPFFGGDTIGYLDIAFGSLLGLMRVIEEMSSLKLLDDVKTPLLSAWAEKFCENEAVKAVLPETVKLVNLLQPSDISL